MSIIEETIKQKVKRKSKEGFKKKKNNIETLNSQKIFSQVCRREKHKLIFCLLRKK